MVCGGELQIAFNRLQKNIENLVLGRFGVFEIALKVANVCQLEPRVGQEGYNRKNTESRDKAIGLAAWHRTQVRRGHGM